MRYLIFIILCMVLLSGCKTKILTEYVPVEVEKRIETKEIIQDTTIIFVPEADEKQNTVEPSDTSKLENKYAFSWAFWDGLFLHHGLKTKQDSIPIKAKTKDKIITITIPHIVPIKTPPVVTNELTSFQKFSVYWTIISLLALVVFIVYKIKK